MNKVSNNRTITTTTTTTTIDLISHKRNLPIRGYKTITLEPIVSPFKHIKSNRKDDVSSTKILVINNNNSSNNYYSNNINYDIEEEDEFEITIPIIRSSGSLSSSSSSVQISYKPPLITSSTTTKTITRKIENTIKQSGTFSIEELTIDSEDSDSSDSEDLDEFYKKLVINNVKNKEKEFKEIQEEKKQLSSFQSDLIINRVEKEREIYRNKIVDEKSREIDESWSLIRQHNEQLRIQEYCQFIAEQKRLFKLIDKEQIKYKKQFKSSLSNKKRIHSIEVQESDAIISNETRQEALALAKQQALEQAQLEKIRLENERILLQQQQQAAAREKELEELKAKRELEEKLKREESERKRLQAIKEQDELEKQRQAAVAAQALKEQKLKEQEQLALQQQAAAARALQAQQQQQLSSNPSTLRSAYKVSNDKSWNDYLDKYVEYKKIVDILESSKKSLNERELLQDRQFSKSINVAINQISASKTQVGEKTELLKDLLSKQQALEQQQPYYFNNGLISIVNKSMGQVEAQITFHQASSFPLAAVLINVGKTYPMLIRLLVGKFYETCPYSVPLYVLPVVDESKQSKYKRIGYNVNQETCEPAETEDEFAKRMCGYLSLLCALILKHEESNKPQTIFFGSMPTNSNNNANNNEFKLDLEFAMQWFTNIVSIQPPRRITSYLIVTFLTFLGNLLSSKKSAQFNQIIQKIIDPQYFSQLSSKTGTEGSISRLKDIITDYLKSNTLPLPEGIDITDD